MGQSKKELSKIVVYRKLEWSMKEQSKIEHYKKERNMIGACYKLEMRENMKKQSVMVQSMMEQSMMVRNMMKQSVMVSSMTGLSTMKEKSKLVA